MELPRPKHEKTLRISVKDYPNVAGVIATEKNLKPNEEMRPSELAATAIGAFLFSRCIGRDRTPL